MRRILLLLALVAVGVLVAGGIALAATVDCASVIGFCVGTNEDDRMIGTDFPDQMAGLAGDDKLVGRDGGDELVGNEGSDTLVGGRGEDGIFVGEPSLGDRDTIRAGADNDRIEATDGKADTINCGSGFDTAFVDNEPGGVQDRVSNNCEVVI